MINTSSFKGTTKNFTFQHYVTVHQKAYNELDELGEPGKPEESVSLIFLPGSPIRLWPWQSKSFLAILTSWKTSRIASNTCRRSWPVTTMQRRMPVSSVLSRPVVHRMLKKAKKVVDKFYTTEEWEKLGHSGRESVLKLREKKGKSTYRSRSRATPGVVAGVLAPPRAVVVAVVADTGRREKRLGNQLCR
jgi:hypothetical protein